MRGSEVGMPVRPLLEPLADFDRLVGRVVVHHDVHADPLGHRAFDLPEECEELPAAMLLA